MTVLYLYFMYCYVLLSHILFFEFGVPVLKLCSFGWFCCVETCLTLLRKAKVTVYGLDNEGKKRVEKLAQVVVVC